MDHLPDYEALYTILYAYHFGAMSFLEVIEQFESMLNIASDQTEAVDEQIITVHAEGK